MEIRVNLYTIGAASAGVLNAILLFAALFVVRPSYPDPEVVWVLIMFLEFSIVGGVPAYLLLRYRLVTPLAWSGLLTGLSVVGQRGMLPFANFYAVPFVILFALGVVVVLGVVEYHVRGSIALLSNEPLV